MDTKVTDQNTEKPDITTTGAIRMVLYKAATVEEAIALLHQYNMHFSANTPYHFQIADAKGDSATVEYLEDVMYVYRGEGDRLCSTNFVLTPGEYFNHGNGQDRWQIISEAQEESQSTMTVEEAMDLLAAAAQDDTGEDGVFSGMLWSGADNNTERTLYLCCNVDYETVYRFSIDGRQTVGTQ